MVVKWGMVLETSYNVAFPTLFLRRSLLNLPGSARWAAWSSLAKIANHRTWGHHQKPGGACRFTHSAIMFRVRVRVRVGVCVCVCVSVFVCVCVFWVIFWGAAGVVALWHDTHDDVPCWHRASACCSHFWHGISTPVGKIESMQLKFGMFGLLKKSKAKHIKEW